MKEININGIVYAKYQIDGTTVYLKMLIRVFKDNERLSEDFLIHLISSIENKRFYSASYLNI